MTAAIVPGDGREPSRGHVGVVLRRSVGRLRVAVPPPVADPPELESRLRGAPGVCSASFSLQTGNLLVTFDPRGTDEAAVLSLITSALAGAPRAQAAREETAARLKPRGKLAVQGLDTAAGWLGAEGSCRLGAVPGACVGAILDFAAYPEWQEYVTSVKLLERDRRGRGSVVHTEGSVGGLAVTHVMRYRYPSPTRIGWEQVEGELGDIRGEWRFRAADRLSTEASLRLEVRPTRRQRLLLRGPLVEQIRSTVIAHALGELGARVEAAAGPRPRADGSRRKGQGRRAA